MAHKMLKEILLNFIRKLCSNEVDMNKKLYIVGIVILFLAACSNSQLPENEYDTDLSITHLDISLRTNFEDNRVSTVAKASVRNFSRNDVERAEFWVCPGMNDPDLSADVSHIYYLDKQGKRDLEYSGRTIEDSYNEGYEWEIYSVSFGRAIKPGEKFDLEFEYAMTGKPDHSSSPIWMSKDGIKELFLRGDFYWCPSLFVKIKPGVFAKLYEPSWELSLEYPSGYVGVVDGEPVSREENEGIIKEEWRSLVNGYPQVFICKYKTARLSEEEFTLEIYAPDEELVKKGAENFDNYVKIFKLFAELYGHPGPTTYRIIGSPMQQGGNGLVMGLVIAMRYLERQGDMHTIAHELAHTWWGTLISSYGEGSKFLREAVGDFSAAWAIREIRGEKAFIDRMSRLKRFLFYGYFTRKLPQSHYPLIQQEGYDPTMVVGANYTKGPFVVNQIRIELGNELFFKCLGAFAREYKGKKVDIHDFIATFNQVSGKDLTKLFRDLLWSTDYPIYRLVGFESKKQDDSYKTVVKIRNDGEFGVTCPVLLKTKAGERRELFLVGGRSENELRYVTSEEVVDVIIDPDLTGFHYDPCQKARSDEMDRARKEKIDVSKIHPGNNWGWFNASYIQYLNGNYERAIEILSRYFTNYMKIKDLKAIEEMGREPFSASYIFTRGLYYLADGQNDLAESDFKLSITGMLNSLPLGEKYPYGAEFLGWPNTGVLIETGDKKELISLINLLTGKDFPWDDNLDKAEKERRVEEWKKWWEMQGKNQKLNLMAVRERFSLR